MGLELFTALPEVAANTSVLGIRPEWLDEGLESIRKEDLGGCLDAAPYFSGVVKGWEGQIGYYCYAGIAIDR